MHKQFAIVSYIEGSSKEKIRLLQEKMYEVTGSRKCLDDWLPHITLGSGVSLTLDEGEILEEKLIKLFKKQSIFNIVVDGFGGRTDRVGNDTTPYVLWLNIQLSSNLQNLMNLVEEQITKKHIVWYQMNNPYTPHITIAFRDLTKEGYEKGLKYLEKIKFKEDVPISHIALAEKTNDGFCEYKRFEFDNKKTLPKDSS